MYFPSAKSEQDFQHFKRALLATLCQADGIAIQLDAEPSQGMNTYGRLDSGILVKPGPVSDLLILAESIKIRIFLCIYTHARLSSGVSLVSVLVVCGSSERPDNWTFISTSYAQ
jgi:hypothetical protein